MQRRTLLAATGAVTSTALAGCLGSLSATGDGPENGSSDRSGRAITVSAEGETRGEPDLAVLSLAVQSRAERAEAARSELAADSESLVAALEEAGIPEDNITTDRFRIGERLDRRALERDDVKPSEEIPEEYRYYEGTHAYRVELEETDRVGEIIDTAIGAGADDVGRVTFTLTDEKRAELREEAIKEAIGNARDEAEVIATEVGATIVDVTLVDASDGRITPFRQDPYAGDAGGMEDASRVPTSIESRDVTVTATIQVQYEIEG